MRRARRHVVRTALAHVGRPGWRRWFPALFALALLLAAPALTHAAGAGSDSVSLVWTAPGDDSLTGTATQYDLRVATSPIDETTWDTATPVASVPAPLPAGTTQRTVVHGLTQGVTYWFAIRTVDEAGNWSALSNVVQWDWTMDTAPPSVPTGVLASRSGRSVQLNWSPSPDLDLLGYAVYRAGAASGPWTRVSGATFPGAAWTDASVPSGVKRLYYAVTAEDVSGNESAKSSAVQVNFGGGAKLAIEPVYPNPSRAANSVRIPVDLPDGATSLRVDIVDALGRRVRGMQVNGLLGETTEVQWDGRSDDGRGTPPGIYRAVLVANGSRSSVRLVRLP